ncbi:MAG: DedA family protein [Propionicimonas sp.]
MGLYLVAAIDGVFPPIPSEAAVIALAALSISDGSPNLVLVLLAAAAGAFTGDQIAFTIGRRVDVCGLPFLRGPRGIGTLDRAERALTHRGPSFILAARYIPVGRVAANMTAGALGYPRRRFAALTAIASLMWSIYSAVIGIGAGAWLADDPLIAIPLGVAAGITIGLVGHWFLRQLQCRRQLHHTQSGTDVAVDQCGAEVAPPSEVLGSVVTISTATGT